jgi:F-box and WD-40 domain protein CDC4
MDSDGRSAYRLSFPVHDQHIVTCLQFDSDKIVTGSDDQNVEIHDMKTGALRCKLEGHEGGIWCLRYHGNMLVTGSTDQTLRVWNIEQAKCEYVLRGHTSTVRGLEFLLPEEIGSDEHGIPTIIPEEPVIISASRDSTIRIWKVPRAMERLEEAGQPYDESGDESAYLLRVLKGHQHSVRAIAAHGDTVVSGSYDCTVRTWEISTGEMVHEFQGHTQKVYCVALDHERNRCMSGSMDMLIKIWCLSTGNLLYNLEGHSSLVGVLSLRGDFLVSGSADSTLRIWNPENGECKHILTEHKSAITCVTQDDQRLVAGGDGSVKMWNIQTGKLIKDLIFGIEGAWQVELNNETCVAAVYRDGNSFVEVCLTI